MFSPNKEARMMSNLRLVWDEKQPERIDPEVKEKWLEALRNGEYSQTIGVLQRTVATRNDPKGYCCLGVLADTLVDDEEKVVWRFLSPRPGVSSSSSSSDFAVLTVYSEEREDYVEEETVLPDVLANRLHMTVDGELTDFQVWSYGVVESCSLRLTNLNDQGFTFAQIADLIEYFL